MKQLYLLLFLQFCFYSSIYAQYPFGEINGFVIDEETEEAISFANIRIEGNGKILQTRADFDGYYAIGGLETGFYTVTISYIGYIYSIIDEVKIRADKHTNINFHMPKDMGYLHGHYEVLYRTPLIQNDRINTGHTFTQKQIKSLPTRQPVELLGNIAPIN